MTTPGLGECISGAILYDETIRQRKKDGTPFVKAITDAGIIPGIKVDIGAKDMAGHPAEKITEGLDGLREPNRLDQFIANVAVPTGIDRGDDVGSPERFDVHYGMADKRIGVTRLGVPERLPPGAPADGDGSKAGGQT